MNSGKKAILVGAGLVGLLFVWADADTKYRGRVEAAEVACKNWASGSGTFTAKSGPYRFNDEAGGGVIRETRPFSHTQEIRFCRSNNRKQLTEGAEFRRAYINDSCHMGLKFDPYASYFPGQSKERAMETFWEANCGGKGNPSRVVKTWSW